MRIRFFRTLGIAGSLIASNTALTLGSEPADNMLKPFSAQSNYMSQLGYARWNQYLGTKSWPRSVEIEYFETGDYSNDPDTISILRTLQGMIKRNPLACEYVVEWSIMRWGMDWRDEYTGKRIYRRHERKLLSVAYDTLQTHQTRRLDDGLLIRLLAHWDEIQKNECDHDKAYRHWFDWWDAQK